MYDGSNYQEEPKSLDGVISIILCAISYIILVICIVRGVVTEGTASKMYGIIGIGGALASICAFVFAVEKWKEDGGFMTAKRGGIVMSAISTFLYIIVLVIGIVSMFV